jgi:ABC-type oligopeptide transport system substrate-binding subunit
MARRKMKVCNVTGIKTSENNFYNNQNHVKAVDNLRRNNGVSLDALRRTFNNLNEYGFNN